MKTLLALASALLVGTFGIAIAQTARTPADLCAQATPAAEPQTRQFTQAEQVVEPGVDYRAILCTGAGPIYVDLFEDYTPITVNNFVFLAQQGYYNNTTFHRVIQDFMAQGGDPTATGSGGPGYQFPDEFVGFLNFDQPGWLAMANANRPEEGIMGTNGSQFFITTVATQYLDYRHTIFGQVLEGQENVANIELRDPGTATKPGTTLDTVVIITDPSTVRTTYEAPTVATQEEVEAAFAQLANVMPEGITPEVATQTTDELVAAAPTDTQDALQIALTSYNHAYRVSGSVAACQPDSLPFMDVSYSLDAFATPADAAAALADPVWAQVNEAQGLTESSTPQTFASPLYSETTTACDVPAVHALTRWRRGRFVATAEATIPADSQLAPDIWLNDIVGVRLFEPIIGDVLRREIR